MLCNVVCVGDVEYEDGNKSCILWIMNNVFYVLSWFMMLNVDFICFFWTHHVNYTLGINKLIKSWGVSKLMLKEINLNKRQVKSKVKGCLMLGMSLFDTW